MIKKYVAFVCLAANASVHSVTLGWTQSNNPDIVSQQGLQRACIRGPYPWHRTTEDAETSVTVQNVNSGTCYCKVTVESTARVWRA